MIIGEGCENTQALSSVTLRWNNCLWNRIRVEIIKVRNSIHFFFWLLVKGFETWVLKLPLVSEAAWDLWTAVICRFSPIAVGTTFPHCSQLKTGPLSWTDDIMSFSFWVMCFLQLCLWNPDLLLKIPLQESQAKTSSFDPGTDIVLEARLFDIREEEITLSKVRGTLQVELSLLRFLEGLVLLLVAEFALLLLLVSDPLRLVLLLKLCMK